MHPLVKQLVALQQVDVRVAGVQKKIDSIPRETARRKQRVDDLRRRRNEFAKAIQMAEAENQDLESKVNSIDVALKRQEAHRDQASNAASFTAAQHQIEYLHQDKEKLQTRQLGLMEQLEQLAPQLEAVEAELMQAEQEFAEYEEQARRLHEELQAKRETIAGERARFVNEIPQQSLALYQDMFQLHDGQAVVPAENGYCSGCYTKVTPNDLAYLQTGSTLVSCKSCGRILYIEDF